MSKPAVIFVGAAMAVTAGCVALIANYGLGVGFGGSLVVGLASLAGMVVIHLAFMRAQPREDPRIEELNLFAGDLADRLEAIERRLESVEGAMTDRARAVAQPLFDEIAALGGLVTTVAKEVAAHDVALTRLKAEKTSAAPAPAPVPSPAAVSAPPPAVAVPSPPSAAAPEPIAASIPTPAAVSPAAPPPAAAVAPPAPPVPPRTPVAPPAPARRESAPAFEAARPPVAPAPTRVVPRRPPPPIDKIVAPEAFDPGADDEPAGAALSPSASRVRRALAENRVEPYLQPIVTLPSRRTSHYEAFSRIGEPDGVLTAEQFIEEAAAEGSLAQIDARMVERCASVALRVSARGGGLLFLNIARETLSDAAALAAITAVLDTQADLRKLLVFEFSQKTFEALADDERNAVEAMAAQGLRFSIDKVEDLRLDARSLARRGVRYVKLRAERLLDPEAASGLSVHPADLANLLVRAGVELVATHVEHERTVPELLDMEVQLAQGQLFSVPRPVRPAAPAKSAPPPNPRLVPRPAVS